MQTQAGEGTLFRQTPSGLERRQQSRVYGRGSQGANGTESIARKPPCLTRGKGKITTRCGKRPRPGKGPGKGLHEAFRGAPTSGSSPRRLPKPSRASAADRGSERLREPGSWRRREQTARSPLPKEGQKDRAGLGAVGRARASAEHPRFLPARGPSRTFPRSPWASSLAGGALPGRAGSREPGLAGPGGTERDPESLRTVRWDPTLAVDRAPRSSLHFRNGPLEITSDCHHDRRRENSPGLKERPREK